MNITLFSDFVKRRNSTKRPSGGVTKSVALKDNTSHLHPSFLLSSVDWNWNYLTWGTGRFYYVTDIVQEANNLFRVDCQIDVLATFKTQIGAYSTLIARSSADQNYDVIDTLYPAKARPITKRTSITNPGLYTTSHASGCYALSVVGSGGPKFYVLTPSQMFYLFLQLCPLLSGETISTWITKQISQAPVGGLSAILQNIVMMKWLPINYSMISSLLTPVTTITIGAFEVTANAGQVNGSSAVQILNTSITFPDRDDNGARGRWLYVSPFASYSVYIPPFGLITIDPTYVPGAGRQLVADIMADVVSGNVTLRLYYTTSYSGPKMIGVYNANLGQDLRAGGTSANVGGLIGGVAGAIASYGAEKYGDMIASIASAANSMVPSPSQVGGGISGPAPDLDAPWYAYATYFDPIDENQAELGRPLGEIAQISTLAGYVKTAKAQLAIPGHTEEMEEVNTLLDAGIFYE